MSDDRPIVPGTPPQQPGRPQRPGPADLAELKATDALLDRLVSGGLSARDREDPLVSAFAQLRVSLDEPSHDAGLDVARLIEVLGDRPLYLVDTEEAGDGSLADSPINLGAPAPAAERRFVDVRDGSVGHARPGVQQPAPQPAAPVAARVQDATTAAFGATVRSIHSITAGRRATHSRLGDDAPAWQRIAEQVALPAASVVLLLALGSGVSAAVTGDPMAPVAGVSKVVRQLPGIDDGPSPKEVGQNIDRAGRLAASGNPAKAAQASQILSEAGHNIADLPKANQPSLKAAVGEVQSKLTASASPAASASATTVSPAPSTPATTPEPPASASATASSSAPSTSSASASSSSSPPATTTASSAAAATTASGT